MTAECFHEFIHAKLPLGLTASHRGGTRAEALAAVCAHQLGKMGYGCSLDFSSCFDTVDLRSISEALGPCLPAGLRQIIIEPLDVSFKMDWFQWLHL